MNFFIGKIAKSIYSYSDSLDFARIMSIFYFKIEILKKLIGKLKIIEKKLNKIGRFEIGIARETAKVHR